MTKPQPRFYEVEVSRAIRAAEKCGKSVQIENGVIKIVDNGENQKSDIEREREISL